MQYTKPMIDQVFQIRKAAPDHLRAQIKLADPDLLDVLASIYREFHDKMLRELIKQLMLMAGPNWLSLLDGAEPESRPNHNQQVYRGQIRAAARVEPTHAGTEMQSQTGVKHRSVIYRGQVVHS